MKKEDMFIHKKTFPGPNYVALCGKIDVPKTFISSVVNCPECLKQLKAEYEIIDSVRHFLEEK